ncbi:MAG: TolC family protein, partial [Candidatus Aureabacteria bacterium]|nr:TolC family protein [Candidatus Auribacterota bacterium]
MFQILYCPAEFLFPVDLRFCLIVFLLSGLVSAGSFGSQIESEQSKYQAPPVVSLGLEQAVNRALKFNRVLKDRSSQVQFSSLALAVEKNRFELKIIPAMSVGWDHDEQDSEKVLSGSVELYKSFSYGTEISVMPFSGKKTSGYLSGIMFSLSQPVFRWRDDEYLSDIRSQKFNVRHARRMYYLAQVSITLNTLSSVYRVVENAHVVQLNLASVKRLEKHAEAARIKEKIGLAEPLDIYRANIELQQAKNNLAYANEEYENSKDDLKILLVLPLDKDLKLHAPLVYSEYSIHEKEAMNIALVSRVELIEGRDFLENQKRLSKVARQKILPDMNLVLNYSKSGQEERWNDSLHLNDESYGVRFITSTSDLFRKNEKLLYQQTKLYVEESERSLETMQDEIRRAVRMEIRNLKSSF